MAAMEGLQIFTLDRPIGACGPLRSLVQNPSNGCFQPILLKNSKFSRQIIRG